MTRSRLLSTALAAAVLAWAPTGSGLAQASPAEEERFQEALRELVESPAGVAFLEAYLAIRRDYLYGVDAEALLEAATASLVEALGDPLSTYLDPEVAAAMREATAAAAVEAAQVGDIGLIRLSTFDGDAIGGRFSTALDTLIANGVRGFVLDLRGNGGGSILQGLQVLDRFLSEGELGYRRVRGVSVPIAYANPRAIAHPLVVLVDEETASTAEIVAGTVQAYGRGRLIGTTTAGKGVGQTAIRLADGAEIRLVTFEWLLPGLRSIDSVGLTPDVFVSTKPADPVSGGDALPLVAVGADVADPHFRLAIEALRALLGDELATNAPIPVPTVSVGPTVLPDPDPDPAADPGVDPAGEPDGQTEVRTAPSRENGTEPDGSEEAAP